MPLPPQFDTSNKPTALISVEGSNIKGTDCISSERPASQSYPPSLTERSTNGSAAVSQQSNVTVFMDSARTGSGVNQPHTLNPNNHNTLLPRIEETSSQLGGTFQTHRRAGLLGGPLVISGTTTHKGRSFGQSHWVNLISLVSPVPHGKFSSIR